MIWICPGRWAEGYFPPPAKLNPTYLGNGLWWYYDVQEEIMQFWQEREEGKRRYHIPCGHVNDLSCSKCQRCSQLRYREPVDKTIPTL